MPLNFPSNPSLNDTYTVGDKKWVYDGKGWKLFSAASELVPGIYNHANGAFDKANSANVLAQAAYNQANSISLTGYATETFVVNSIANLVNSAPTTLDTLNELASALGNDANFSTTVTNLIGSAYNQANASNVLAQSSYTHANGSFDKANSANVLAQQAYNQANTGTGIASNAYAHANGAFDRANSANVLAQSAFNQANTANAVAQAAYNQANTANLLSVSSSIIPSANITYDLGTPTQRWRDLYLSGNTIDIGGVQISANNGGLTLPPVVAIGNTTIDGTSGGLILPASTSIGGSAVATPRVSSIDYPGDDTAANPTGGQVIGIVGSGFQSGASVILDGQTISVVTYVNSQRLEITTPAKATGSYIMYIVNPDGGTGIFVPGIQYSGVPTWQSPAAGSLGSVYETNNVSATFSANSDSTVTYSLFSGTLPPGSSLNSSTGVLSGTAALTDNATTYNFTIRATDGENQDTDRAFSLTINPDVITWVSPANGSSYQLVANSAISSVSLSATSAAGDSVVYTANALPTGISISGSTITGTPTTEQTLSSLITARGNTTNSTATIVLNWSVVVRDLFFSQTTLLLNANTNTWITDESPNGFEITPFGDAKPSAFSPFNTNWSNFFDGTGDYLSFASNSAFNLSGQYTIEFWINASSALDFAAFFAVVGGFQISLNAAGYISTAQQGVAFEIQSTTSLPYNRWNHIAATRDSSNVTRIFLNGTQIASATITTNYPAGITYINYNPGATTNHFTGSVSNLRLIKGTALYTSNFTPSTTPLTAVANTVLLTCQSNRFIDNSTNNFTITRNGDVRVTSFGPFTETDTTTGSAYFDGTGDKLTVPDNEVFNFGSGNFTVEAWVYPFSTGLTSGRPFYNQSLGAASSDSAIYVSCTTDGVTVYVSVGSGWTYNASNSSLSLGSQWNHVAAVREGTALSIYVNGTRAATTTLATNWTMGNSTRVIEIGSQADNAYFNGYISGLRVVKNQALYSGTSYTVPTSLPTLINNTSLLTLQTRTAHNNNTFFDESGNKFNITRNGNATQGSFSPFSPSGWSAYFDGASAYDYLTVPASSDFSFGTGDFTVEAWSFIPAISNTNGKVILDSRPTNTNGSYWVFGYNNQGFISFTTMTTGGITILATQTYFNQWVHVAATRKNGLLRLWVNGSVVASSNNNTHNIQSDVLKIGMNAFGGTATDTYYEGYLSNIRVVKGTAVYDSNFTPSTIPLEPIANTVLLTCRSNRFEDESRNRFTVSRFGDTRITPFSPFGPHTITPRTYSVFCNNDGVSTSFSNTPTEFDFGSGNFTVEVWVNPSSLASFSGIFGKTGNATKASGYLWTQAAINTNGTIQGSISTSAGSWAVDAATSSTVSIGSWSHIAVVRNGSDFSVYVNGVKNTLSSSLTGSISIDTASLTVGRIGDLGTSYNLIGYVSNFRVVKGTAVYTSNFTPSTLPLTAIANTQMLSCQSESLIDNSNNRYTITGSTNTTPSKYNPFGETVATNVQYSPTVHGGSGYFDGTGDSITIPANSAFAYGTGDFTIEAWVYQTQRNTGSDICSCHNYGVNADWLWSINSTGNLFFQITGSSTGAQTSTGTVPLNAWTHVAVTRSGGVVRQFINGTQVSSATYSTSVGSTITFSIGAPANLNASGTFYGYISNLEIKKGIASYINNFVPSMSPVFSSSDVLTVNFTAAGISDATSKNVLETVGDVEVITESPYSLNQSVYFDGTGDFLTTNYTSVGSSSFCIEAWVNFDDVINRANYVFIQQNSSVVSNASLGIGIATLTTGRIYFFWNVGTTQTGITTPNNTLTSGTWNHIACVRNGNTFTVYVNGVSVGTTTNSNAINTLSSSPTNRIGQYTGEGDTTIVKGYISNFRFVIGSPVYTTNFTPPTTRLTAVANTSLLTCHTNRFIDSSTNNFTITRNGDAKITSRGPFTETRPPRSLKFDGSTGNLVSPYTVNYSFGTGDFTVEGWFYFLNANTTARGLVLLGDGANASGPVYNAWSIQYLGSEGSNQINWQRYDGTVYGYTTSGATINTNEWTHIAISRASGILKIFVNGIAYYNNTVTQSFAAINTNPLRIGLAYYGPASGYTGPRYWPGLIEDLRITKYARYTSNFTPPTTTFLTF